MSTDTGLLRGIVTIFNAVMTCTRLIIYLTFFSTISIQIASGKHYSQLIVEETVTIRKAGCQIRQRSLPFHTKIVCLEIIHRHTGIFRHAFGLIRRLLHNCTFIKRLKVAVKIHGIISG